MPDRTEYNKHFRREKSIERVTANRADSAQMAYELAALHRQIDEFRAKYDQPTIRIPIERKRKIMDETMSGMVAPLMQHERDITNLRRDHDDHEQDPTAHGILDHSVQVSDHATRLATIEAELARIPTDALSSLGDIVNTLAALPEKELKDMLAILRDATSGGGEEEDEEDEEDEEKPGSAPVPGAAKLVVPKVENAPPAVERFRRHIGSRRRIPVKK